MDLSFNILNCFDDNIDNLDITKYQNKKQYKVKFNKRSIDKY